MADLSRLIRLIQDTPDHRPQFILWFPSRQPSVLFLINMKASGDCSGVNLSSLLTSGNFSDLKLMCEGREFPVHKAILCSQSRVFNAECEGGFEVKSTIPSGQSLS